MSRSIPPDKRSSLVAGFVLNTLDEFEAQEFGQLVASDPTLLEDVAQLQQSLEVSYAIEEVTPPPMLRDRLLSSFADQPAESSIYSDLPSSKAQLNHLRNGLKAAVAALAIAFTLSNYLWWQSSRQQVAQSTAPVTRDRLAPTQTYTLSTTEAGESGTVLIEVDPDTLTANLIASDLPLISADQVYVLWTVLAPDAPYTADSKSAILTTTFTVDSQGESQKALSLPSAFKQVGSVAALGITIESAEAPQAHEGVPVLLAPVQS
ncbi:MAG: anti-sigma factor [Phormidesmis sp.]